MQPIAEIAERMRNQPRNGHAPVEPDAMPTVPQPATLAEMVETHPKLSEVIGRVRSWAERRRETPDASLVLVGPNGTGKTHLARVALWSVAYVVDGVPVAPVGKFFAARDLVELIGAGNSPRDLIGTAPLVVIDDVGAEGVVQYVAAGAQEREIQARYFAVLNYCYGNKAVIITASNNCGTVPQLADYLGPRSWDRLLEMAPAGYIVDMAGVPSYRRTKGGR